MNDIGPDREGVVPPDVLDLTVRGTNLRAGTLGEELGGETTLLAFLRHLG